MSKRLQSVVRAAAGAALLLAACAPKVDGQEQPMGIPPHAAVVRTTVVVDAAHGGADPGADLGNKKTEKDATLALAKKLQAALSAQGVSVVLTRDGDPPGTMTADQRAEIANRSRPMACVSLHATRSGAGVHIYTSAVEPTTNAAENEVARWDSAQAGFVAQSVQLAQALKAGLSNTGVPATTGVATVPPLDSMMCPAAAVEFAPGGTSGNTQSGPDDGNYQDAAARGLAAALVKWRADVAGAAAKGAP